MREIKFRAYYGPEKTWFSWDDIMREFSHYDKPLEETSDWKVMQFTGLFDKNDVEIYEGDIVKVQPGEFFMYKDGNDPNAKDPDTGQVSWIDKECCYRIDGIKNWWPHIENSPGRLRYEVIGNIYENKELLK